MKHKTLKGGSKTFKLKGKQYHHPIILSEADFIAMWIYEFERLNPGKDWREWAED